MTYKVWRKEFDKICVSKGKSFEGRDTQIEELYNIGKSPLDAVKVEMHRTRNRKAFHARMKKDGERDRKRLRDKEYAKKNLPKRRVQRRIRYNEDPAYRAKRCSDVTKFFRKNREEINHKRTIRHRKNILDKIQEEVASLKNDNWFMEAHNKRIHLTK